MMELSTVSDVLACCDDSGFVPVNVAMDVAIEAHRQRPCASTLYTICLARQMNVADMQAQMDYLAGLPDAAWEGVPHWEEHREATLAAISRSIAWRSVCA